jgi:starch phosphorylase
LDRLVEANGDPFASPWEALHRLGPEGVEALFASKANRRHLGAAYQQLNRYLTRDTWFNRARLKDHRLLAMSDRPVAYFCLEFGLARWLPIYSGGLGILAGDVLKEASDMGLPFVGIGLFYRHGFFRQVLDDTGYQREVLPSLDPTTIPLQPVVGHDGHRLKVSVPVGDRTIHATAWKLQVGRTPLYLLDTDIEENALFFDRAITDSLYGGDQETRILQEIVVGIGGVRALKAIGIEPSIFSMNEGHAAFLSLELLADRLEHTNFANALEDTQSQIVYTNHTVVPAGNDVFSSGLVRTSLERYASERGIGIDRLLGLGSASQADMFSMAVLAFQVSGKANAVSELHGAVIPREWPGFPVEVVTNGVHIPSWIGPDIRACLDEFVPDWSSDSPTWDLIRSIPNERLWEAHCAQRRRMIAQVNEAQASARLHPDALTIVWARRFAEYKRAWLLANDPARLARLLSDSARPVQVIYAGKAHPRDEAGKRILQDLLQFVRREAQIDPHVAFVPDYNVDVARALVSGADVWLNTPRKPLEASGTSGMKSSDNGGLQVTVQDGWAAEVDWQQVGWGIEGRNDAQDASDLFDYLENGVVPIFFAVDDAGVPNAWVERMKNTMIISLRGFSSRRMMLDYVHKLYLPLLADETSISEAVGP